VEKLDRKAPPDDKVPYLVDGTHSPFAQQANHDVLSRDGLPDVIARPARCVEYGVFVCHAVPRILAQAFDPNPGSGAGRSGSPRSSPCSRQFRSGLAPMRRYARCRLIFASLEARATFP
jgi:hypothetical protein